MLSQDVKTGFLPRSESETRGSGRIWEEWEVGRAFYLYRLRKHQVDASVIRTLLFLKDGWGWEQVKPLCISGIQKFLDFQTSPVRRRYRKPDREDLRDLLVRDAPSKPKLALFAYGLGYFAKPLEGGTLLEFFGKVKSLTGVSDDSDSMFSAIEELIAESGFTYDGMMKVVTEAREEEFQMAGVCFRQFVRSMRCGAFQYWKQDHELNQSTNLITLCNANKKQLQILFRKDLKKMTLGQFLAAFVGILVIVNEILGLNDLSRQLHNQLK